MRLGKPFFVVVGSSLRWVDPDRRWQRLGLGTATHEAFGMFGVGRFQNLLAGFNHPRRLSVVQHRRRQKADAGVVMFVVVPLEKRTAETDSIFVAAKTVGEFGAIFHRLELAFGERIVVRYVRPTMRLGHPQRGQQLRHVVRGHRRPAIAVDCQLIFADPLVFNGLSDQT